MGPDITNNESGKAPYALVIYCNNNLNILIVVNMMRMTWTSFMQFLLKVDKSIMKHFCHHGGNKRGATATIMKRCHGNVPVPVTRLRYRWKGEVCGCVQKMVGRSLISGVPRVGDKETSDTLDTVQTRASHTSQAFVLGRSSRGYTFEAFIFEADGVW